MKRLFIIVVLCICGGAFYALRAAAKERETPVLTPEPTYSADTPSTAVQGAATKSPTSTPDLPQDTPAPVATNACVADKKSLMEQATAFMQAHQQHDATKVLSLMTAPETDDDQIQYNYLTGSDSGTGMNLYVSAQTSYTTVSFTFGNSIIKGQDQQDRGNTLCTITVQETRQVAATPSGFSKTTVTRYIDFSITADNQIGLSAFKASKTGSKYSGFNN